jgi:hypothetical protein
MDDVTQSMVDNVGGIYTQERCEGYWIAVVISLKRRQGV